jgi:hypothetical protein
MLELINGTNDRAEASRLNYMQRRDFISRFGNLALNLRGEEIRR